MLEHAAEDVRRSALNPAPTRRRSKYALAGVAGLVLLGACAAVG
jgi:hypothetical protein